jgi:hypothetical protein
LIVFLIFFAVLFNRKVTPGDGIGMGLDICGVFGSRGQGYALRKDAAEVHQL